MRKLLTLLFVFVWVGATAQVQIVLQNGAKTEVYNNINTLLEKAVAGDTIYLPGVGISLPKIEKQLHWIGTGHYPSATKDIGQTIIAGNAIFSGKCDGSSFEGIYFTGNVYFGDSTAGEDGTIDECTGITIKRCRINGKLYLRGATTGSPDLDFVMRECVTTNYIDGKNGKNCLIERCIITGHQKHIENFVQSQFKHNIISLYRYSNWSSVYAMNNLRTCSFENNIFPYHYGLSGSSCNFKRNVFIGSLPYSSGNSQGNVGSNNMINVQNIFQNIKGDMYRFDYANDYHFKGFSGDTIKTGIYGGTIKYKADAVPFYPQVTSFVVDENADPTTKKLGVKATVKGQER